MWQNLELQATYYLLVIVNTVGSYGLVCRESKRSANILGTVIENMLALQWRQIKLQSGLNAEICTGNLQVLP